MKKEFTISEFFEWLKTTKLIDSTGEYDENGNWHGEEIREDVDGSYWSVATSNGWKSKPWNGYHPRFTMENGWDTEHIDVHDVLKVKYEGYYWETVSGRRIHSN